MSYIERPPKILYDKGYEVLVKHSQLLRQIDSKHPYWTKLKYLSKDGIDPVHLWSAIRIKRSLVACQLPFTDNFWYCLTEEVQGELYRLDKLSSGIILDTVGATTGWQKKKFILTGLIQEAFSSSTLEGAVSTRFRAKELIGRKAKPLNKSDRMILNNYLAMEFIRENKEQNLSIELLIHLHAILGNDAMDQGMAGAFRNNEQHVAVVDEITGEDIHIPPPAHEVEARLTELLLFFNSDPLDRESPFVHPILKACIVHFMIGYIHPFSDGNGRLARSLFYWSLLKSGYWIAEYLTISKVILESKHAYYKAFVHTELDTNDLTYFLRYKVSVLMSSFANLREHLLERLNETDEQIPELAVELSITLRQAELLKKIKDKPATIWKVQDAERLLNVSHATARADLRALTERGLLEMLALDKKTQGWRLA